jgi:hypothetical protein
MRPASWSGFLHSLSLKREGKLLCAYVITCVAPRSGSEITRTGR